MCFVSVSSTGPREGNGVVFAKHQPNDPRLDQVQKVARAWTLGKSSEPRKSDGGAGDVQGTRQMTNSRKQVGPVSVPVPTTRRELRRFLSLVGALVLAAPDFTKQVKMEQEEQLGWLGVT